jgi:glycosyltransferase involved in cell wall biosynthesis
VRILLLVDAYLPHPKSQAKLIHDLGVALVRLGHEVTVLAPSNAARPPFEIAEEDGLRVVRASGPRIKGAGRALRAIYEERLSALLWRRARPFLVGQRFDLIVFYSPTIFLGRLVGRLKRLWRCPAYLVLRDIFPQWAVDAGVLRKGLVWSFFRRRELQQYAVADVIGVQSPGNLDYFRTLGRRRYRLDVLYNWAPVGEPACPPSTLRARVGATDEVIFFYGGNVGVAQDMDNILRLARAFPAEPRALFVIVGDGSEVDRLRAAIADERIANVRLLPAVGQEEYRSMLREADAGLISLDRRLRTHNFPGKMLGYMQAGLPILASLNPGNDLAEILGERGAGLWSSNGDDGALLQQAVALASDAQLRSRMGSSGRRLLEEKFSAAAAARQIVGHWSEP